MEKKAKRCVLDHISLREMFHEKNLLGYWAGKGHNAIIILVKREGSFDASAPAYFWVTKLLWGLRRGEDIFEPNKRSASRKIH
jgi:hypothetical protein